MALYPTGTIFSDSLFQDSIAQATARQQLAQNRADEDLGTTEYDYGVTNTANPYSQQALLNRSQKIQGIDAKNQAASRPGSVRSGAYRVRNANMVFGQGQQQDALQKSYQQARLGYKRQGEDINSAYNQDIYNAGLGSVQRKLEADQAAGLQSAADREAAAAEAANRPPLSFGLGQTFGEKKVSTKRPTATAKIKKGKKLKF